MGKKEIGGWDTVTSERTSVYKVMKSPFQRVVDFVAHVKRPGLTSPIHTRCGYCLTRWDEIAAMPSPGDTHLLSTNNGNMLVCDECIIKILFEGEAPDDGK